MRRLIACSFAPAPPTVPARRARPIPSCDRPVECETVAVKLGPVENGAQIYQVAGVTSNPKFAQSLAPRSGEFRSRHTRALSLEWKTFTKFVIPGLDPGIHGPLRVDGRVKPGHDELR